MAVDYIDRLASKLYTMMKGERLEKGLEEKRPSDRIGVFQELLIDALKKSTLCCFNGRPYHFNGAIYVEFGRGTWDAFNSLILRTADKCGLPPGDKTKLDGVKKVCRGEIALKQLEPDNSIVVLKNGVLDLESKKLSPFHPRFKQVTQMDFDYDPEAYPYLWMDKFLPEVLDEMGINLLQEFMGAIFLDRRKVKIEKMLILLGAGSNGKSVIQQTLIGLLGEENVKTLAISELIGGSDRKQNIASINGKRLNYCSELQTNEFGRNSDTLKALISGEPFEVRLVYVNNFTARNIPLLMANANKPPIIKDVSHGLGRRLLILPFERVIEDNMQDKRLAVKLRAEYSGILNWMLAGRQRLINNKYEFTVPKRLRDIVLEAQSESSSVLRFMKENDYNRSLYDIDNEIRWLRARKLYHAYVKWCVANSLNPESENRFGRTLTEAGFTKKEASAGVLYGIYQTYVRPIKEEYKKKNEANMVEGMDNLAHWCGVSRQIIEKMLRYGKLDGCFTKEGRRYWFFLDKCRPEVRRFLRQDKRRDDGRVSMVLKADRRAFNQYMKKKGLPFRKYEEYSPHSEGAIIYVTDEFNYQLDKNDFRNFLKFADKVDYKKTLKDFREVDFPEIEEFESDIEYIDNEENEQKEEFDCQDGQF